MINQPANARSRRTRDALLAAARELIENEGMEAATMGAVADRAGVTRRSVYLHFESRSELIGALFDYVAETEGLSQSLDHVFGAPTALGALSRWAAHLASYHARVLPVDRAISHVERTDVAAAAHRARARAAKLDSCRRLAKRLDDEGVLAEAWTVDSAADMLYALTNSDLVEALLEDRAWAPRRFKEGVESLLRSTFTTSAAVPSTL